VTVAKEFVMYGVALEEGAKEFRWLKGGIL
jgi:hypothetical protein